MIDESLYKISASSFYNLSKCQRRVYMDLYGNPEERGKYSEFLQLLWERGTQIETEIMEKIRKNRKVETVEGRANPTTFAATVDLMKRETPLIYQGVLIYKDHIGRPDILEKVAGPSTFGDYHYIPCDIKSGRATTDKAGDELKEHYVNQMLFYTELLEKIQNKKPSVAKILDVEGMEITFPVDEYFDNYKNSKSSIESIVYKKQEPELLFGGTCKECVWFNSCLRIAQERQDPTLLFKLGKEKIPLRERGIRNIEDVSRLDVANFLVPPNKIYRVGEKKLTQWKRRATVWLSNTPIKYAKVTFRKAQKEIFYDVEDDPSLDHIYLHGFIEIFNGKKSGYKNILAPDRKDEEKAAKEIWQYIKSLSDNDVIYHYGSYEKTKLTRLKEKYNLPEDVLEKFDTLHVDLYRTLEQNSDWPSFSYGIKNIAKCLGFAWTAEDASGANSIAWYNEYRKDPENKKDLFEKILNYNKEDCEAMIIVKEWLDEGGD